MRPDWIGVIAFLAALSASFAVMAWTGGDRKGAEGLMVIGTLGGLLVCVEWCVKP